MNRTTKALIAGAVAVIVVGTGAGIAVARGGNDTDRAVSSVGLDKVRAAALAHTGGGRVTEVEVGDEDSYYEVDVTFADGREVDVHLDKNLNVVQSTTDVEDDDEDD